MKPRAKAACLGLLACAAVLGACAPKTAPPTVAPKHADFVFPAVPAGVGDRDATERHQAAWDALQADDLQTAEQAFSALLKRRPDFYPAEAGLGYVAMSRRAYESALQHFDAAETMSPRYAPALVGRGEALLALDRAADALTSFETAVAVDPSLQAVRSRIEALRFRVLEATVGRARKAAAAQHYAEAATEYDRALAMSPDSALLHREAALVQRDLGQFESAMSHARRALELEPGDVRGLATLGEVYAARKDYAEALAAFEKADRADPTEQLKIRIREMRDHINAAGLPPEYAAISASKELTRGDLAALVAVRLEGVLRLAQSSDTVFITDTRGHWAASYILEVARAGVMEVYPNYTFQPGAVVQRGELASVVSALLGILEASRPVLAERWRGARQTFTDLPSGHLSYPAAALAAAAGVMPPLEGGTFQLARVVTGAEAIAVVERIDKLAGMAR